MGKICSLTFGHVLLQDGTNYLVTYSLNKKVYCIWRKCKFGLKLYEVLDNKEDAQFDYFVILEEGSHD
jgi:hypothetical protein